MRSFLSGLRGKLTLTYTLVTVLAVIGLEVLALLVALLISSVNRTDERNYLNDVIYVLYPRASLYLQPGKEDLPGLQRWLDEVAETGYASLPAQNVFDSPAAALVPGEPLLVVAPDGTVLAQAPLDENHLLGRKYTPPDDPAVQRIYTTALDGNYFDPFSLSDARMDGKVRMAVPVMVEGQGSPVVGVILLTVEPAPPMLFSTWPVYLSWVMGTGLLLLIAVVPFGALFGFIMSRGLTRRLTALARAADAWSQGDLQEFPVDRSRDEIGILGMRLRHMAERIQNLLQSQHELAILEERNRLARELHDTVKQQSFATLMQVRAAKNLLAQDPDAAHAHLDEAETLIKTSQQELGLMISELRPAALEGHGLVGALRAYLDVWSGHSRIPATLQVTGERRLPLPLEQALFRVAQEALSNAARHSRASAVSVQLLFQPGQVIMEVADNGVGFDPQQSDRHGFGLESMRARLAEQGGRLEIHSAHEQGTRLAALVPVPKEGQATHADRQNQRTPGR